ncbi:capsular biosynthesis protein [Sphaerotilus sp.]|jgi:capsular polysaccharide transport system permease protein|uniref:capsular biosynthesis protein n=1 Tax=Sphaerotilus sp. TaxID=2093942 RepID=UPI0025FFA6B0|nr:capsular biosynthesis protein [Sphaerotilus sp.]
MSALPPLSRLSRLNALCLRHRLAALTIGLPMVLAGLYYGFLASDRYVSTTVITVRRAGHEASVVNGLSMLLPGAAAMSQEDTRYLREYLHSQDLLLRLDQELALRAHFESAHTDVLHRLWPHASQEQMLDYWRRRVELSLDDLSGLLTVRVQGFDAEHAQRINRALLREAESFVNDISHRISDEQLAFAKGELGRAEEQLTTAQRSLIDFQTRHRTLDPQADAQATGQRAAELRGRLTKLEAELSTKRAFLHDDAPDIVTLRAEVAAVEQQIGRETRSATATPGGGEALNRLALTFHDIKTRAALADGTYRSALATVEATRIEASRKVKSLVVIEPPTRPETAEYPRRLYELSTLLLLCLAVFTIAHLGVATVREHQD